MQLASYIHSEYRDQVVTDPRVIHVCLSWIDIVGTCKGNVDAIMKAMEVKSAASRYLRGDMDTQEFVGACNGVKTPSGKQYLFDRVADIFGACMSHIGAAFGAVLPSTYALEYLQCSDESVHEYSRGCLERSIMEFIKKRVVIKSDSIQKRLGGFFGYDVSGPDFRTTYANATVRDWVCYYKRNHSLFVNGNGTIDECLFTGTVSGLRKPDIMAMRLPLYVDNIVWLKIDMTVDMLISYHQVQQFLEEDRHANEHWTLMPMKKIPLDMDWPDHSSLPSVSVCDGIVHFIRDYFASIGVNGIRIYMWRADKKGKKISIHVAVHLPAGVYTHRVFLKSALKEINKAAASRNITSTLQGDLVVSHLDNKIKLTVLRRCGYTIAFDKERLYSFTSIDAIKSRYSNCVVLDRDSRVNSFDDITLNPQQLVDEQAIFGWRLPNQSKSTDKDRPFVAVSSESPCQALVHCGEAEIHRTPRMLMFGDGGDRLPNQLCGIFDTEQHRMARKRRAPSSRCVILNESDAKDAALAFDPSIEVKSIVLKGDRYYVNLNGLTCNVSGKKHTSRKNCYIVRLDGSIQPYCYSCSTNKA